MFTEIRKEDNKDRKNVSENEEKIQRDEKENFFSNI